MIGYMMNAIIPLRLGGFVCAFLIGARLPARSAAWDRGVDSTVVVERIFDVVAIVIIGLRVSTVLDLRPLVKVGLRTFALVGIVGMSLLYGLSFWGQWNKRLAWLDADVGRLRWPGGVLLRFGRYACPRWQMTVCR